MTASQTSPSRPRKGTRSAALVVLLVISALPSSGEAFTGTLSLTSPRTHNGQVLSLQQKLLDLGFETIGAPDGWYGPLTQKAVVELQTFLGFDPTGIVTRELWNTLFGQSQEELKVLEGISRSKTVLNGAFQKQTEDLDRFSTEGGQLDTYTGKGGSQFLEIRFFGEGGKSEFKVIYFPGGFSILRKETSYPNYDNVDDAEIAFSALYQIDGLLLKVEQGRFVPPPEERDFVIQLVMERSP